MPAWLPILKASLPYISQVVSAALPHFTSKSSTAKPDDVVPKQIAELQAAATDNAKSIKDLAAQLGQTIEGIDAAADNLQRELRLIRRLAGAALIIALVALGIVLWSVMGR
jgi:hypothetical protein